MKSLPYSVVADAVRLLRLARPVPTPQKSHDFCLRNPVNDRLEAYPTEQKFLDVCYQNQIPRCPLSLLALLIVGLLAFSGCDSGPLSGLLDPDSTTDGIQSVSPADGIAPNEDASTTGGAQTSQQQQPSALIIGAFNIQTFGRSKMSKPEVVNVLADIAHRFDILAIQELRNKDQEVIPAFLKIVNRNGSKFAAAVSRRIGYTDHRSGNGYQEQLVYLYDTTRVKIEGTPYVAEDRHHRMHRPPYIAQFRCLGLPAEEAFSFVLMNVHTDFDDTVAEFAAMEDIIGSVFPNHPQEDDFILLGDLNDDAKGFQQSRWFADQFATIPSHWKTNTRLSKSYDNIVFDVVRTAEFVNLAGVLNLMQEYRLNKDAALDVSDHMPVWAVFSTREAPSDRLSQSPQMVR